MLNDLPGGAIVIHGIFRAGDLHHLLKGFMKQRTCFCFGCFVINLFSITHTGDQATVVE